VKHLCWHLLASLIAVNFHNLQLSPSQRSLSLDSYSADDNDNSGRLESRIYDEGLFSHEEYPEHNNPHANDDEHSSLEGILMKSEMQQCTCITVFSSDTGCAGIVGYAYKSLLAELFGWGTNTIVWSAFFLR